ncbi:starvation-inducible DNA-binding protein [Peribacillus deserti]|uniref:Starvation-inducible DNA-binding protein n=1 Tax=Peribacillus deserti TaxID=673318 RepID=A0ABS2QKY9_9BACI|nr:DNA starvation/stationary phase protection protein [Peribacillus deserti]MBM7693847.1 starvation-inducible DNA-binding protein [Peribacillus deserti]
MSDVSSVLNQQVANWTVLYTKLHNYHWFVRGENFFTLHIKFEELYNEANQYVDELAERLLAIKGRPVATLKDALATATIKEASGNENTMEMVETLRTDFQQMIEELAAGMEQAQAAGDEGTSDLLLGISVSLEKHLWMFSTFLEG